MTRVELYNSVLMEMLEDGFVLHAYFEILQNDAGDPEHLIGRADEQQLLQNLDLVLPEAHIAEDVSQSFSQQEWGK